MTDSIDGLQKVLDRAVSEAVKMSLESITELPQGMQACISDIAQNAAIDTIHAQAMMTYDKQDPTWADKDQTDHVRGDAPNVEILDFVRDGIPLRPQSPTVQGMTNAELTKSIKDAVKDVISVEVVATKLLPILGQPGMGYCDECSCSFNDSERWSLYRYCPFCGAEVVGHE